jgi:DNA modification methylase
MSEILFGDCRDIMNNWIEKGVRVQTCVTSPPYFGLRDYKTDGQLGIERTPEEYVSNIVQIFSLVRSLLSDDGTLWLNLGDTYAANRGYQVPSTKGGPKHSPAQGFKDSKMTVPLGLKPKDLIGIPWRTAFALQADGWYLRSDIIWHKPNVMPSSVKDRVTTAHEYIFMLAKSEKYYYDADAIREPASNSGKIVSLGPKSFAKGQALGKGVAPSGNGLKDTYTVGEFRNKRSVWTVTTKPFKGAHSAVFPTDLILPCVLAGSRFGDTVLDPFMGSGTTAQVAHENGRQYLGCELNPAYKELCDKRLQKSAENK